MTTLPASQKGETDHKADPLVYEMYELTQEETRIMEAGSRA
jgi:hypothetical protein